GRNHGGGAIGTNGPSDQCVECHTASPHWESVSGLKFDNQIRPMCETMRHLVELNGRSGFVNFLASDPVVGLGFEGLRGMDEASPYWPVVPEPPPMDQASFAAAIDQWITEGRAECTAHGWSGTIIQTTALRSVGPGSDMATDFTITFN